MVTRAPNRWCHDLLGCTLTVTRQYDTAGMRFWEYEGKKRYLNVNGVDVGIRGFEDVLLTPIRPGSGEDETLRFAGRPREAPEDFIGALNAELERRLRLALSRIAALEAARTRRT